MYKKGEYDLAGFSVGAVKRSEILPKGIIAGDMLIGTYGKGILLPYLIIFECCNSAILQHHVYASIFNCLFKGCLLTYFLIFTSKSSFSILNWSVLTLLNLLLFYYTKNKIWYFRSKIFRSSFKRLFSCTQMC